MANEWNGGVTGTCPSCGAPVMAGELFCMTCGMRLLPELVVELEAQPAAIGSCPMCGADVNQGDKFCTSCGADLSQGGAVPFDQGMGAAGAAGAGAGSGTQLVGDPWNAGGGYGAQPADPFAQGGGFGGGLPNGTQVVGDPWETGRGVVAGRHRADPFAQGGGFGGGATGDTQVVGDPWDIGGAAGGTQPTDPFAQGGHGGTGAGTGTRFVDDDDDDPTVQPKLVTLTRDEARRGCRKQLQVGSELIEVEIPAGVDATTKLDVAGYGRYDEMTGARGPLRLSFYLV